MLVRDKNRHQSSFFLELRDQLDQSHPIYQLANKINWDLFEREFAPLYCSHTGRPAKPIRLMVGLLILKHLRNISDESVVEQWGENAYYQYFCGAISFTPSSPCDASELVHFRHRIGQKGVELILAESIRVNDDDRTGKGDNTAFIDSTVQEKNITYPTDAKLHKKIVKQCQKIAQDEHTEVRQSYTRTLKELSRDQRFRNHPKNRKKAIRADKRVKSIAGRLVRELERNLPEDSVHRKRLVLFTEVLSQTKSSKQKIYSLHEPDVQCISKGKEHKKYEFGNKVSIISSIRGVILGALSLRNEYDGHTIDQALEQVRRLTGKTPKLLAGDRGYRGQKLSGETEIVIPGLPLKRDSRYVRAKKHKLFCKRAGIEPRIGHLKADHRLGRNFYKGLAGDAINVMLAAAAFNFKRAMRTLLAIIEKWILGVIKIV
ncbi:MAG: IS5 family transposase, partial [Mucinivorans sp.]